MSTPRQYSLCRVDISQWPGYQFVSIPFANGDTVIFLGEIPNQPDHCIVWHVEQERIYAFYHTENFVELTEEEL